MKKIYEKNGYDGGGYLNYYNPKKGDLWEIIRTMNFSNADVGSVFW